MDNLINSVLEVSQYVFDRKLVSGKAGNISGRIKYNGKDIIAITPTLISLNRLKYEDIVLVDIEGNFIGDGISNKKPSSELFMHLNIYKKRNDINGIVHTHSPYVTGFSFSDKKLKRMEGFGKIENEFLKEIPYKKPGSEELAIHVASAIGNEDVLILKKHGVIALGKTIEEAGDLAEFVEETSKIQFISNILNGF
ncbi:class II aldolase/adducin family protein [Methanobrevibacter curvatus]|uniref:L-fuculose phosphate aldolase n=1 Tax=Methanobrevibacter curvatus TaxID=49547 RepID=A0A166D7B9_9EURY|nr:class II aldolase/adducin family protein [Methanobrevibacter curvatus]KZX15281.1 L-fuculose phosphate aldolase [Methanobrevibacter curvatus]